MTDSVSEVTRGEIAPGPLVAIACLFYFSMIVLKDIGDASRLLFALAALPRGSQTLFENNTLLSISFQRLTLSFLMMFLRVCVAFSLVLAGMIWLALTNDMTELILNTTALSFVLAVDELLFQAMLPSTAVNIVKRMKPLKYRRARWKLEAVLPFIVACFTVGAVYRAFIVANIYGMQSVRRELCQGNTEFVSAKNGLGVMVGRKTGKFAKDTVMERYESQAVWEVVRQKNLGPKSNFNLLRWFDNAELNFESAVKRSAIEESEIGECRDRQSGGRNELFERTLVAALAQGSGRSFPHVFDCSHYQPVCDNFRYPLMRVLCPVTCGCNDLTSGLLFSEISVFGGCPRSCRENILKQIDNVACLDLPVASTALQHGVLRLSWKRYWETFSSFFEAFSQANDQMKDFYAARIAIGCKNLSRDPVTNTDFCSAKAGILATYGLTSIAAFCPDTCCRLSHATTLPDECPPACNS
eukprot:TRINITY_DN4070_c0_g2_i2.p1 TRINITY_DN4070_c0_g2~~TRINITY_DN4070_c0_g2_i2.p1  ORF type:complete len:515 (-),score=43.27 TRINITY_DN4070_c0_g2_i2:42-1451(-)